jgi:hypothetical protein
MRPVLAAVAVLSTGALTVSLLAAPAQAAPGRTRVSGTLSAPATTPGVPVTLSGYVKAKGKGKKKRTVVLEQKIASGWRKVARTKSDRAGAYAMTVPTDWFYSSKMRARVVKKRKYRGATSRAHRLTVSPAYVPLGSPTSWVKLRKEGDRWNPCKTVTYGINSSRATPDPATVAAGIHNTIALVSQATGVRFKFAGETAAAPFDKKFRKSDPMLTFAFTTDAETPLDLGPTYAARGGSDRTVWSRDARGKRILRIRDGGVLYDLTDTAQMTAAQFQQLTLHEMGHAMGLGHVPATDQYMTAGPELYNLPLSYQAGDLAGLAKVGLQAGCIKPLRGSRKVVLDRTAVPDGITLD